MIAELVLGMIVLLAGTEIFVRGAVALAQLLKWSPLVIGVTVVAIGTSTPELTVSFMSAIKGDYGLAMGNLIGSNIVNAFLVLGFAVMVGNIRVGTTKTPKNAWMMILCTFFYWFWHIFGDANNLIWSYAALMGAVIFTTIEIWWAWWGRFHEDEKLTNKEISLDKKWILVSPVAIYLISVGGGLVVNSLEYLSISWGISTTILGLILSSLATSLPELATTAIGLARKQEKLVIGNILGSNIYNLMLVGGLIGFWGQNITIKTSVWIVFLISAITLIVIVEKYKGKHIPKNIFWWLLAGFGAYLLSVF